MLARELCNMALPPPLLDAKAVSGITGSISIACWVIVFAPQIYENFCRKSSEGLSLLFIALWLSGDLFNVLGSILQNLLPTMIILAIYYTMADIVLLCQCLMYWKGKVPDLTHLSPANPVLEESLAEIWEETGSDTEQSELTADAAHRSKSHKKEKTSQVRLTLINILLISLVLLSGILGWYVSNVRDMRQRVPHGPMRPPLEYNPLAQFFGWICAFLYLGSRVPQILLNFRRKSCDGISFLFFMFACLGNMTYVISILSVDTSLRYLWINASWLVGSSGTLLMDLIIFIQFFFYHEENSQSIRQRCNVTSEHFHSNYGSFPT